MVDHTDTDQHHGTDKSQDEDRKGGFFVKPLSGSFGRLKNQVEHEVTQKSPSRAIRDDIGGSPEPTDEEWANLQDKVDSERDKRHER